MIEGSQTIILSGSVWTQLLTALVVGLLVAFALQVLLTSLGVAIGLSVLAMRASSSPPHPDSADSPDTLDTPDIDRNPSQDSPINTAIDAEAAHETSEPSISEMSSQLGFWAGAGVLLMVNTVLFAACFLAARFSQAQSPLIGAIEGIVIWSAYLLILLWLSSTAVSSVVGSLLGVATSGFRRMIRPIGSLFASEKPASITETELLTTVRQEIQTAFNPQQLQSLIRAELQQFPVEDHGRRSTSSVMQSEQPTAQATVVQNETASQPSKTDSTLVESTLAIVQHQLIQFLQHTNKLTAKRVDRRLRELLDAAQFVLLDAAIIPEIDRSKAMRLLMYREDLSEKQRDKILNQIEKTWNEFRRSNQEYSDNEIDRTEKGSLETDLTESNTKIQQLTATALETLAEQLPNSLTHNEAVERVMQQLPELLQQAGNQLPTGASLAALTMALLRGKDLLTEEFPELLPNLPGNGLDPQQIRQTLDRLMHQSGMADLSQAVVDQVDHLRDRSMQQIEQVQQTVQEVQAKVDTLKTQTSQQLQATQKAAQKAATIAAWWLFLTVTTGAISSALAGAIANRI